MKKALQVILAAAVALTLIARSMFIVDESRTAIVTKFGRYERTESEPGLKFKLPYQSRRFFDKRTMVLDPRPTEFLTSEKKNITADFFLCWRIADPREFLLGVRDVEGAEDRLFEVLFSSMSAELGQYQLADLLTIEGPSKLTELSEKVTDRCAEAASERFGIEVVDVRIKRLNFPTQNRPAVFERMRAERDREAQRYRSEGQEEFDKITSQADLEAAKITSEAYAEAEQIRGEGDAEAARIFADAIAEDPEFYEFTRTLEVYRSMLNEQTTLFLSPRSSLMKILLEGLDPAALPEKRERPKAVLPPDLARGEDSGN